MIDCDWNDEDNQRIIVEYNVPQNDQSSSQSERERESLGWLKKIGLKIFTSL